MRVAGVATLLLVAAVLADPCAAARTGRVQRRQLRASDGEPPEDTPPLTARAAPNCEPDKSK